MGLNCVLLDVISLGFTKMNCLKTTKQALMSLTNTLKTKHWNTQGVETKWRADWRRRYFKVNTDAQKCIQVCVMSVPKHPTRTCVRAQSTATRVLADFCGHTRNNQPPKAPFLDVHTDAVYICSVYKPLNLDVLCVSLALTLVQCIFTHIAAMLITGTHHTPHITLQHAHPNASSVYIYTHRCNANNRHTPHITHHITTCTS